MLQLTQKERMLLEDQKSHEELCIKKYMKYANEAQDTQLKQLFAYYASVEQEHLNTVTQILNGQVPSTSSQGGQQQQQQNQQNFTGNTVCSENDIALCKDALTTEKYVSSAYDTTIFECTDKNVRQVLNHIQKEEQEHGEGLFNYLKSKGAYKLQ
ncbi:spore coat protein [Anaerosolibacter sp.]|uniref:spore coat protein n=1 Tax=Anaerosolibacter sp. TaxID=1872527 RepID=UPI0039EF890D